jgi:hypothetical protein
MDEHTIHILIFIYNIDAHQSQYPRIKLYSITNFT